MQVALSEGTAFIPSLRLNQKFPDQAFKRYVVSVYTEDGAVPFLTGLLAGLWEFPSFLLGSGQEKQQKATMANHLQAWFGNDVAVGCLQHVGEVRDPTQDTRLVLC